MHSLNINTLYHMKDTIIRHRCTINKYILLHHYTTKAHPAAALILIINPFTNSTSPSAATLPCAEEEAANIRSYMKMLTSIFRSKKHTWGQWPSSCKHPKTISFRVRDDDADGMFKTVNSVYLDVSDVDGINTTTGGPSCFFTNSTSTSPSECRSEEEPLETVVSRVVKSERRRLFFQPDETNSILMQGALMLVADDGQAPFKESVAHAMESENPYLDFRRSMEEIVEYHGLKEWGHLVELLEWYLKVNGKKNHKFIIQAFIHLLMTISAKNMDVTSSYSSAISSISSPSWLSSSEYQMHEEN